jgi:hypothetical protein
LIVQISQPSLLRWVQKTDCNGTTL